ncbi:lysoplasmalogenase family protein [Phytohabitans kaempferiae]|uniref:Lysoplasmalogenase family protein n=1 Tax=Phytohabitans kaempferiae TaxID=1620943 RepID=A0ABV6MAF4_9ACTN
MLYATLGAVHVAALAVHSQWLESVTKPLLVPALALYVIAAYRERGTRVSRRLLLSLALACAGGVALRVEGAAGLIVGMVFFLVAYTIYAAEFIRSGAVRRLRRWPRWLVPIGYGGTVAAAMVWLWPGLREHGVALPMAGYAALMALMASAATTWGWRVGLGAGLLVASDILIGIGLAGTVDVPGRSALVMATYLLGLLLVVGGWTVRAGLPAPAGSGLR